MGGDQFGSVIMFFPEFKDQNLAVGKIEYTQVTHAGQVTMKGTRKKCTFFPGENTNGRVMVP